MLPPALLPLVSSVLAGIAPGSTLPPPAPHTPGPDWRAEATARIERHRKGDFVVRVEDAHGQPVPGARVTVELERHRFLFGVAVEESLLVRDSVSGANYRAFILDHFNALTSENAMKWYSIEKDPGTRVWDGADAVVEFAAEHGLPVRGHCLFWDRPKFIQPWVQALDATSLRQAVRAHGDAVAGRYRGRVICWDVNNEMLDGGFYTGRLGPDAAAEMFRRARASDPDVPLFTNEFGILDSPEKTARYRALIRDLLDRGAPVTGIGIQEHAVERFVPAAPELADENPERKGFRPLDPFEAWARLDELAGFGLPIHLTEISAKTSDPERRAESLEMMYRVGFAHPRVDLILLWGFWEKAHWLGAKAALIDANWNRLPAADRLSHLLRKEWHTAKTGLTGPDGRFAFRGFHGSYAITVTRPHHRPLTGTANLGPDSLAATLRLGHPGHSEGETHR